MEAAENSVDAQLLDQKSKGNAAGMLGAMLSAGQLSDKQLIATVCGSLWYMFYTYVDRYKQYPVSLDVMVDGLLFICAHSELRKRVASREEQTSAKHR